MYINGGFEGLYRNLSDVDNLVIGDENFCKVEPSVDKFVVTVRFRTGSFSEHPQKYSQKDYKYSVSESVFNKLRLGDMITFGGYASVLKVTGLDMETNCSYPEKKTVIRLFEEIL